jgi:kynureninase
MTSSAAALRDLSAYRDEFPIFRDTAYLNTCSLGPLSVRSRDRVADFLDVWDARGASAWYDVWWEALAELRAGYGAVIGARSEEIALHASVSTATSVVAGLIDAAQRPKVVTTNLDFPTVAYQWLAKESRGVEVVVVESPDGVTVPPELIAEAVDDRTAVVATSHVYFTTGAIQDVQAVAAIAHRHGALCFIDAYQSVGQLPVDVHALGVDALCAGGLKWLLGGPGIVFLYVRDDLIESLTPTVTGWFAHAEQFAFDPTRMAWHDDARRFEMGTPALAAVYAQLGGLEILREIGLPTVRSATAALTEDLIDRARAAGLTLTTAPRADARSAIVMVQHAAPAEGVAALVRAGVIADARPGHIRLSPFFYNTPDDYVRAIETLRS